MARRAARTRCPACGNWSVVPILYGLQSPTPESERGDVIHGGCEVTWETVGCASCQWRGSPDDASLITIDDRPDAS